MYQHPNKPCPCGSGKKAKKCHPFGAPVHGCEKERIPVVRDSKDELALLMLPLMMIGARMLR